MQPTYTGTVELYWIPLGAGGRSVRVNGRVFEAFHATLQRRERCDLYHAALVIEVDGDRYTIEVAPSPDADEASRGVVGTGAVGSRHLGWWRRFRYHISPARSVGPPHHGRAPGWHAGLEVARRGARDHHDIAIRKAGAGRAAA